MLLERAQARCQKDRLEEQYLAVRIQTLSIHQAKRLSAALISLLERARGYLTEQSEIVTVEVREGTALYSA